MNSFSANQIEHIIDSALAEDLSLGDITTEAIIAPDQMGQAYISSRSAGVLAGIDIASMIFHKLDHELIFDVLVKDGHEVLAGDRLALIQGRIASILKAERSALNFLQHLSGIATETARYVKAVDGTGTSIMDTRKTTPGLRLLEKYAVKTGGGKNHRQNLGDGVIIKDNHLSALSCNGISLSKAVRMARQHAPHTVKIEVEVENIAQAREALHAGADIIMLDNMSPDDMRIVVERVDGTAIIEASGGITLDNVRLVADTGVDLISIGALTHSVKALDIGLDLTPTSYGDDI